MLAVMTLTGCRDEHLMTEGEGTLRLSTTVNSEVEVVSRALSPEQEQALAESAVIWISDSKGLLYEYKGASNVPSTLRLLSGHYTAEAWVGDSVPASWDKTFYKSGFNGFDIASGTNTDVTLRCRVANTLASVNFTDEALNMLTSPVMTISLDDGITDGSHSLEFDETHLDSKGRFMINSRTKGLTWKLTGTEADGSAFEKSGTIENIKPATEYRLNVKFVGHDLSVGGAFFDIDIEEEPVGSNTDVKVLFPPKIEGMLGFDKDGNFRGEEGKIDRKSIFVSSAAALEDAELSSADIAAVVGGDGRVDVLHIEGTPRQSLIDAGIDWQYFYDDVNDTWGLRINFEDDFTNSLTEGDHAFTITVVDVDGRHSSATFTITVTNAPVATVPVDQSSVSYTSATLEGTVLKEATEYGFELREVTGSRAYEDWTRVPGTVSGSRVYAQVSDLKAGTNYEYRMYADGFVSSDTQTFYTLAYPQLPNSGFEEWSGSSPLLLCANEADMFWDSGNHGSATMSKNVTEKDSSVKNSGSYSAKLASQFVGLGSLGKFAAGNLFIGKYLNTDGTDGVLGWGRPWEFRPKAVKVWVKYAPVAVTSDNSDYADLKKGDMDKGIIYIALLTDETVEAVNSKGNSFGNWPVVVKTKSSGRSVFDKNAANVIGYGEKVFTENTGSMIQVTIPIDYKSDAKVKNIMMVASASIGGDYFTGGNGSTMWLDDVELVY